MTETTPIYELRPLQARDLFPMTRILSKIGFGEFKKVLESDTVRDAIAANKDDGKASINLEAVGVSVAVEFAGVIIEHLADAEQDIYALLASLSGLKVKDIAEMPLPDFVDMIVALIKKPEFSDFFKRASSFAK